MLLHEEVVRLAVRVLVSAERMRVSKLVGKVSQDKELLETVFREVASDIFLLVDHTSRNFLFPQLHTQV